MKRLLIVVDYQNDFVDGALGFDGAEYLEEGIVNKISEYKEKNDDIVFTLDTHYENYMDTVEGKKLPIKHCIIGTNGHELYGRIKELSNGYPCFNKETFGSKELFNYLLNNVYQEIELCGLVSNICVISNAIVAKTVQPNSKIVVLKDLTSSNDLSMQEKGFDILRNLHIEVK